MCLVAVESSKIPEAPVVHFVRATDKAAYISTYKVRPTWAWRAQRGPRPGRRRSFQSHCLLHRHRTVTFPQDGSSELCRPVDRQEGNIVRVEGLFSGCLPPTPNSHLFFISSSFFFLPLMQNSARGDGGAIKPARHFCYLVLWPLHSFFLPLGENDMVSPLHWPPSFPN